MKKSVFIFIPILIFIVGWNLSTESFSDSPLGRNDTITLLSPKAEHFKESLLITSLLNQHHYRKTALDDSLSSVIYESYIEALDPNRSYFQASDLESFEKYRHRLDNDLKRGNLDGAYFIFNTYKKRGYERIQMAFEIIEEGFDFDKNEFLEADRSDYPWPKDADEARDIWRRIIKNQALNLKLEGKEEEESKEILENRYKRFQKALWQTTSSDVFQIYMNAFSESFDPHTSYFSPISSENFKIGMSRSLEGIGARLVSDNDYTKIYEVVAGGPAFKSKKLFKDDRILGVAQEDDEDFTDVFGWRLDEVVQLIRGPKGTVVRLRVLPADASRDDPPIEITMVRDKIKLEDQAAQSQIIKVDSEGEQLRVGVISLPTFYMDFEAYQKGEEDYTSTTRDVKKLLEEMKSEGVDGVLMDLRFNGGGSLNEAIELTGLFIDEGPVVQVRDSEGKIDSGDDPNPGVSWDGSLMVLVNRFSASASEIFAGAIQDYGRGVVIGEQTYGKGTVQNLIGLENFLPDEKAKLGQLKLTLAKYYRVTGSSTQHKGVNPDISFPSAYSAEDFGESSKSSALAWDQIGPTPYERVNMVTDEVLEKLNASYQKRMEEESVMQSLIEEIKEAKKARDAKVISLNYETRKKEREEAKKKREARESLTGINSPNTDIFEGGDPDEEDLDLESEAATISLSQIKDLDSLKDPYLKEGIMLMKDLLLLEKM